MIIINFGHPLTDTQQAKIEQLTGYAVEKTLGQARHFDVESPFGEQAHALVEGVPLGASEWQSAPLLVVLPTLSIIAGAVLAEIHGRCGHFPAVLRLKPVTGALVTQYEVAEILNLEQLRQAAREQAVRQLQEV